MDPRGLANDAMRMEYGGPDHYHIPPNCPQAGSMNDRSSMACGGHVRWNVESGILIGLV